MKFSYGVLPLVSFETRQQAETTLSALRAEGLNTVEIACRTGYAMQAIKLAAEYFPDLVIGAGTVFNGEQAQRALEMGASFLISPGFSEEIACVAQAEKIVYIPGCATPTEIMRALDRGITTVKFFPAEAYGGIDAIRALAKPFPNVKFLPTGGIDMENLADYLALDEVIAVGGSFVLKGNLSKNCEKIRAITRC